MISHGKHPRSPDENHTRRVQRGRPDVPARGNCRAGAGQAARAGRGESDPAACHLSRRGSPHCGRRRSNRGAGLHPRGQCADGCAGLFPRRRMGARRFGESRPGLPRARQRCGMRGRVDRLPARARARFSGRRRGLLRGHEVGSRKRGRSWRGRVAPRGRWRQRGRKSGRGGLDDGARSRRSRDQLPVAPLSCHRLRARHAVAEGICRRRLRAVARRHGMVLEKLPRPRARKKTIPTPARCVRNT